MDKDDDQIDDMSLSKDSWRVFRIISEFVDGFESMTQAGPSVSIFGSSRLKPASPYYNLAIDVAQKISRKGFAIITGGGPGLMEAANKGAQSVNGKSCGLCIDLPMEFAPNDFIDPKYQLSFRYFFIRKVMFIRYASGFVFLPGGFGTMDELFESLTLIQTEKIHPFPIYLMGSKYWKGLTNWLEDTLLTNDCISESDMNLFTITDDPDEVANGIDKHYREEQLGSNF